MSKSISAANLNIHLVKDDEHSLFKWFIASFLMGKRIRSEIAADAYRVIVEKHTRDTPRKLAACTHGELVKMLGEAGYARYDESTAERLVKLSKKLNDEYAGQVANIRKASESRADFEKRLGAFEGIGPKTIEIFMRDAEEVFF
ncbi:DNA methylase [Pseudomonas capeferrum]|uniref:DNA methylase n=1 Tax=Pseudomonas capeferrum TaxID=1495066 RepID=UPI0015E2CA2F|nr:DNA methylase [Pseudomonas capeferrum]MBA1204798.1 DNA methylase [Pseudomonas capeferrum]